MKYPIKVKLIGRDGNAFAILGAVIRELRKNGVSQDEIDSFEEEATSGDYDNLLGTCMQWVDVE